MKKYIKSSQFDDFGHSIDPNDKKTNYKYYLPELDIDGTVDEIYQTVLNNYVNDRAELEAIREILVQNGWYDEAKIVGYYIEDLEEVANDQTAYVGQMKIDLAKGHTSTGFTDVAPWDDLEIEVNTEGNDLFISVFDQSTGESGGTMISKDEFFSMSRKAFDSLIGQIIAYQMN